MTTAGNTPPAARAPRFRYPRRRDLISFILFTLNPSKGRRVCISGAILLLSMISLILSALLQGGWLSLALLIPGAAGAVYGLWDLRRLVAPPLPYSIEDADDVNDLLAALRPDPGLEANGYKAEPVVHQRDCVIRSHKVDSFLRSNDVRLTNHPSVYQRLLKSISPRREQLEIALRCAFAKSVAEKKQFSNEAKLCLADDILPYDTEIRVFKGDYFTSYLTNDLCTKHVIHQSGRRDQLFEPERPIYRDNANIPRIKPIAHSGMGNHIGVSSVGHTADGFLLLWRQSRAAQLSERQIASTGSGSCDVADLAESGSLRETIVNAMSRELFEESTDEGGLIRLRIERSQVLGYFRWVTRGGKPEFVGASKLTERSDELAPNVSEVDAPSSMYRILVRRAMSYSELDEAIHDLLELADLSVPLWVNLICLRDAMRENREYWTSFFQLG